MSDPNDQPAVPGAPRRRRWPYVLLALALMICSSVAVSGWWGLGRTLSAPDWLRERIEERLALAAPGLSVQFGDMSVVVQPDLLGRVILTDVEIRSETGAQIATLANIEAGLAPTKLLHGEYEIRLARMSGAMLTLQRDEAGRLGLALGDVFASETPMPDLPTLIAQVDRVLSDPRLSALDVIEADALTIRYEDARAGRGWTADGGRISLTREDGALRLAGDVALLGRSDVAATLAINAESPIGAGSVSFGLNLQGLEAQDIASQGPALAWLTSLRAPISGALRGAITEDGSLGALSATLQIGAGVLQPNPRTRAIPFESARTYFSFDPATATLKFDEISVKSEIGTVVTNGQAVLNGLATGWPSDMLGQFRLTRIEADPAGFFDEPVSIAGAEIDWRLSFDPFRFELGRFRSTDPEIALRLSGVLAAEPEGWHLSLDGSLDRGTREGILAYWPTGLMAKPRKWVVDNVHSARLSDAIFALRLDPGGTPRSYLDMRMEEVDLTYARTLPQITGGSGQLTINQDRLIVNADGGQIVPPEGGALDIAGSQFVIPNTRERPAQGEVTINARAPLVAALSFLDSPKLEVMQKAGKPVQLGEGEVEVTGRLVLPLKKGVKRHEMQLSARGIARSVSSAELVPGRRLGAERLDITVDDAGVEVAGQVDVSGIPFDGTWRQSFTPGAGSRVEGTVALSESSARAMGIALPAGTVSGQGKGQIGIDLARGAPPRFVLTSDLAGLGLALPQIGWRLSPRSTGSFEISGALGRPVTIDRIALNAAGLKADGTVELDGSGAFKTLRLPDLSVGTWLDTAATLTGRGRAQAPAIVLSGGRLDMRSAPFGTSPKAGATSNGTGAASAGGGPITVSLDRLQVTDSIYLSKFKGSFDGAQGLAGSFSGRVGDRAPVTGQIAPQHGRSAIRIQSRDAGDVLKGAGIFKSVQDGTFDLTLSPVQGRAGEYDGALEIGGARLNNAPAIASLLDAVSVVGLLDQLNGPGIFFNEVEARFRLTPAQVILARSSAVGPSMGISMDGYYDLNAKQMDIQGVVSPIYIINGIGRLFSRKGEGLIGFNFNLKGPVSAPRTTVNPLSVFTPGMFRDIFRRPPPDLSRQN